MKKITAIILLILVLGLAGCKNSVTKSEDTASSKTRVENKTNDKKIDKASTDSKSSKVEENISTPKQQSNKQVYKAKLDNIEIQLKSLDKKDSSGITSEMRQAANERYEKWDTALNEIYTVLKGQLSSSDMKNLHNEEIEWISNRDAKAKKASSEMQGGTMEPVIYTNSLAESTKDRCYELVEKYMK